MKKSVTRKSVGKKKINKSNAEAKKAALIAEYKANMQKDDPDAAMKQKQKELTRKAEKGDVPSMYKLYVGYKNNYGTTGDDRSRKEALKWLERAAKTGDGYACYTLSVVYQEGKLTEKNSDKCMYWMEKCALKLPLRGNFWLGKYYAQGDPVPADHEKAKEYLNKAIRCEPANEDEKLLRAWGKYELAQISEGQDATRLMKESADEGYPQAVKAMKYINASPSDVLGFVKGLLKNRKAFEEITETAEALITRGEVSELSAAEVMSAIPENALMSVTETLAEDSGILGDPFAEDHPFHKNYTLGPVKRNENLQSVLNTLQGKNVKDILNILIDQMKDSDNPMMLTMNALGNYEHGSREYLSLMKEAAEKNEPFACFLLGLDYMVGDGVQADQEEAHMYFTRAMEHGYPDACAYLAHQYYFGLGVKGDADHAMKLLKQEDNYFDSETCERIEDGLRGLYRGRKNFGEIYPFWFMRGEDPVSVEVIVERVTRRMVEDAVSKATDDKYRQIMASLNKLEIITMDTNIRTRGIETSLSDLQNKLAEEKRLLGSSTEEEQLSRFFASMEAYIRKQMNSAGETFERKREYLRDLFGQSWDILNEGSKASLISALVLMEQCETISDPSFDYSGICISATSALEREVKRIFSEAFTGYMKQTGVEESEMEYVLKRIGRGNSFTLGSLPYALASGDKQSEGVKERIRTQMNPYLHEILMDHHEDGIAFLTGGEDPSFLSVSELIRDSYRNTAAHTELLPRQTAIDCIRDVIGTQEQEGFLKRMVRMFDYTKADSFVSE